MRPSSLAEAAAPEERRAWFEFLRWTLYARAYDLAVRAGISDPAERVVFVRMRLDPTARRDRLEGMLAHLERRFAAGDTWVYDRPTLADVVGARMAHQIASFGLLPAGFPPDEFEPRTTR